MPNEYLLKKRYTDVRFYPSPDSEADLGFRTNNKLDVRFNIENKMDSETPTCEVSIFNLKNENINKLTTGGRVVVVSGWENHTNTVFTGTITNIIPDDRGGSGGKTPDIKTTIEANQKLFGLDEEKIMVNLPKGITVKNGVKRIINYTGYKFGKLDVPSANMVLEKPFQCYTTPKRAIDNLVNTVYTRQQNSSVTGRTYDTYTINGEEYSSFTTEDGYFYMTRKGDSIKKTSYVLEKKTGLLNSPPTTKNKTKIEKKEGGKSFINKITGGIIGSSSGTKSDDETKFDLKALLLPDMTVGSLFEVNYPDIGKKVLQGKKITHRSTDNSHTTKIESVNPKE